MRFICSLILSFAACSSGLVQEALAAEKNSDAKKPVSLLIGYFDSLNVSCKWAGHCRDDMGPVEAEYMNYLEDGKQAIKVAVESGASPAEIQKRVYDYRAGLQARETLYGRCPGKCLSYDFPVDLKNSAKQVAHSSRLDLLIDLPAVYFGADLVLKGPDETSKTAEELHRQTARYR